MPTSKPLALPLPKWDEACFQLKPTPDCSLLDFLCSWISYNPFITCSSLIHLAGFSLYSISFSPAVSALTLLYLTSTALSVGNDNETAPQVVTTGRRVHPMQQHVTWALPHSICTKRRSPALQISAGCFALQKVSMKLQWRQHSFP